jgi:Holliday junction resolvase-like predicted endonuclease
VGETRVRQEGPSVPVSIRKRRYEIKGAEWCTVALCAKDGGIELVVRCPLTLGEIDVITSDSRAYHWNEVAGRYERAQTHYVSFDDLVSLT